MVSDTLAWHPLAQGPVQEPKLMGIPVNVYRPAGERRGSGITASIDRFVLVGEGLPEIFEASENMPALVLIRRDIDGEYLHAEPDFPPDRDKVGWMFGGNFVYTTDSRATRYPVPVHDRQETQQQHTALSD